MTEREWYIGGIGWCGAYTTHWLIAGDALGAILCGSLLAFYVWRWWHC